MVSQVLQTGHNFLTIAPPMCMVKTLWTIYFSKSILHYSHNRERSWACSRIRGICLSTGNALSQFAKDVAIGGRSVWSSTLKYVCYSEEEMQGLFPSGNFNLGIRRSTVWWVYDAFHWTWRLFLWYDTQMPILHALLKWVGVIVFTLVLPASVGLHIRRYLRTQAPAWRGQNRHLHRPRILAEKVHVQCKN
jgi:hypothetical protein